jgi:integrase
MTTLTQFLETTYRPLRLRGKSENSVRLLLHAIRQFSKWLRRDAELLDFDDLVVSQFLEARAAKGLSPWSVERERNGLLALWRCAADRRLVEMRPNVQPEVLPEREPRAFTVPELEALYAAAESTTGWVGPVRASAWWPALIMFLYESGERVDAALHVPMDCYERPFVRVPAGVRKGKRKERNYELTPATCDLIDIAAKHDEPTVFLFPYDESTLYNQYGKITVRAGLGNGRDVKFHAIRKSTASHLAAAGMDACQAMGHSSDRVTRKHYLSPKIVNAGKPKVIDALPTIRPPVGPKIHRIA